jgi:hypothetical protein
LPPPTNLNLFWLDNDQGYLITALEESKSKIADTVNMANTRCKWSTGHSIIGLFMTA